eukprot:scaffold38874_cov70-Cyclotella_meneghiniana.AAC.3
MATHLSSPNQARSTVSTIISSHFYTHHRSPPHIIIHQLPKHHPPTTNNQLHTHSTYDNDTINHFSSLRQCNFPTSHSKGPTQPLHQKQKQ